MCRSMGRAGREGHGIEITGPNHLPPSTTPQSPPPTHTTGIHRLCLRRRPLPLPARGGRGQGGHHRPPTQEPPAPHRWVSPLLLYLLICRCMCLYVRLCLCMYACVLIPTPTPTPTTTITGATTTTTTTPTHALLLPSPPPKSTTPMDEGGMEKEEEKEGGGKESGGGSSKRLSDRYVGCFVVR